MTSPARRRAALLAGAGVGLGALLVLLGRFWPSTPVTPPPSTTSLVVATSPGTLPPLTGSPDWERNRPADTDVPPSLPPVSTGTAGGPRPPDTDPFQHIATAEGIVPPDTDPVEGRLDPDLPAAITGTPGVLPPPDTDPHAGRPHAVSDPNPLTARGAPRPRDTYPFAPHTVNDPQPATARGETAPDTN